jgi:hypothetical protein
MVNYTQRNALPARQALTAIAVRFTGNLETYVKEKFPQVARVTIHLGLLEVQ